MMLRTIRILSFALILLLPSIALADQSETEFYSQLAEQARDSAAMARRTAEGNRQDAEQARRNAENWFQIEYEANRNAEESARVGDEANRDRQEEAARLAHDRAIKAEVLAGRLEEARDQAEQRAREHEREAAEFEFRAIPSPNIDVTKLIKWRCPPQSGTNPPTATTGSGGLVYVHVEDKDGHDFKVICWGNRYEFLVSFPEGGEELLDKCEYYPEPGEIGFFSETLRSQVGNEIILSIKGDYDEPKTDPDTGSIKVTVDGTITKYFHANWEKATTRTLFGTTSREGGGYQHEYDYATGERIWHWTELDEDEHGDPYWKIVDTEKPDPITPSTPSMDVPVGPCSFGDETDESARIHYGAIAAPLDQGGSAWFNVAVAYPDLIPIDKFGLNLETQSLTLGLKDEKPVNVVNFSVPRLLFDHAEGEQFSLSVDNARLWGVEETTTSTHRTLTFPVSSQARQVTISGNRRYVDMSSITSRAESLGYGPYVIVTGYAGGGLFDGPNLGSHAATNSPVDGSEANLIDSDTEIPLYTLGIEGGFRAGNGAGYTFNFSYAQGSDSESAQEPPGGQNVFTTFLFPKNGFINQSLSTVGLTLDREEKVDILRVGGNLYAPSIPFSNQNWRVDPFAFWFVQWIEIDIEERATFINLANTFSNLNTQATTVSGGLGLGFDLLGQLTPWIGIAGQFMVAPTVVGMSAEADLHGRCGSGAICTTFHGTAPFTQTFNQSDTKVGWTFQSHLQLPTAITPQFTVSPFISFHYDSTTGVLSREGKDTPPTSLQTGISYDLTGGLFFKYSFNGGIEDRFKYELPRGTLWDRLFE